VIDSLAGFELALAPGFREDFRESLYRMIGALTRTGVTIVSTVELVESFTELALSPYSISFLSDDIIRLLVISDQLIPGRARHGACFDVFEMTKFYGSEYYESEFKNVSIAGEFDLVLISGHATVGTSFISIDGVNLVISRDLSEVRCRIAYLNACHAGNNPRLLEQCFATMKG
jgi:hypothetical protein